MKEREKGKEKNNEFQWKESTGRPLGRKKTEVLRTELGFVKLPSFEILLLVLSREAN